VIRRIAIDQLLPGMYVVDLHKSWLEHDIWLPRFKVRDAATVERLIAAGIREVSIDSERGIDLPPKGINTRINEIERKFLSLAERARMRPVVVSLDEERRRAGHLLNEARSTVCDLMELARMGAGVEAALLEPLVQKMLASIRRNPDALVPLARHKDADSYAGEHAVATAALIVALGLHLGVSEPEIEKLALGTLLKDIGELALDARLIDKPGQLSQDELSQVQRHVEESLAVLEAPSQLAETSVAVILEHHERFDGGGYPYRREGEEISLAGRMAAIVDTFDAMVSHRPYRRALSPVAALRQVFEQSGLQFDPALVASFIHTIGIYPVGTLVRLESGHLAVVEEQNADAPLLPVVRVIYHAPRRQYVEPFQVDLSRRVGNHYGGIVQPESFERWGIHPERWLPA